MKKYILDTSFIQAMIDSTDIHANTVLEVLLELPEEVQFLIPYIVVAELMIGENITNTLESCKKISMRFINNKESDLEYISSIDYLKRKSFKANDCLILSIADRFSAEILSFDKALVKYSQS